MEGISIRRGCNEDSKYVFYLILISLMVIVLLICYSNHSRKNQKDDYFIIGVSQPNVLEPWRIVMNKEIRAAAQKHENIRIIFTDAAKSTDKQISDLEKLMKYGIDLLIVSMNDSKKITPIVSKIYKKIPVIVLDRDVYGYDYTLFIGLDNYTIGKSAGNYLSQNYRDTSINVVEIMGDKNSLPALERSNGFRVGIEEQKNIEISSVIEGNWEKDKAEDLFKQILSNEKKVDVVYAHSDDMAYGAYLASRKMGIDVSIIGMDGIEGADGGVELVKKGIIECTYTCPTGGKEAIEYAVDILNNESGLPKKIILRSKEINKKNINDHLIVNKKELNAHKIILGFAQVGLESSWRIANSISIKEAAEESGIKLIFKNVNNDLSDKEKQIMQKVNIREFIEQKVDVIAFSPIVESGWEDVLIEAKEAGIYVILCDRQVEEDSNLWSSYIGSDFKEEGRRAARWLIEETLKSNRSINIVELEGTSGSAPAKGRKEGFKEIIENYSNYNILYSKVGDFEYKNGKEIMDDLLESSKEKIDVVYAHNDDMALGAIESIENHNLVAGKDILVISVDATKDAFKALIIEKLNCAVECNPLLGPQIMKGVKDLMVGRELPLNIITEESVYTIENAKLEINNRKY